MNFLIGDLQGCDEPLGRLLDAIGFSPSRDTIHLLGDLVNRGPASLDVLRRLRQLGAAATCVLGNHDLHLLAVARGIRSAGKGDTMTEILAADDREALLEWLRLQPFAARACGWLLVHAGVVPQWDAERTLALAAEAEALVRDGSGEALLRTMYGDRPHRWDEQLQGEARARFIVSALTRIRFCADDGTLDFDAKAGAETAPAGMKPWFAIEGRQSAGEPIAFGHWSALGLVERPDLLALDTGCVWGGSLTAARVDGGRREIFQVPSLPPAGG